MNDRIHNYANTGEILPAIPRIEEMCKKAVERTRVFDKIRSGASIDALTDQEKAVWKEGKRHFGKRVNYTQYL
jgi:hypothetical protein